MPDAEGAEDDVIPALSVKIEPEVPPTGHLTLSYATTAAHRRAHWLATARGFSRYLWGAEVYPGANVFGRYLAYGQVEILAAGNPINLADSGFAEAGWDWNCWPGTTAIHLPLERLRDKVNNVDRFSGFEEMLISDEPFAGGSNLGGRDGLFAMKLHEHGKYDGSHRARKSVFFFDDHLVLLGSGITNNDERHDTRTTLFQQRLRSPAAPIRVDDQPALGAFPAQLVRPAAAGASLVDTIGNAYYLLADSALRVTKSTQSSRSQNDKRDTSGDFVLAWLDHGAAPRDAGYAYAILVQPTDERREDFGAALRQPATAPFAILRRDNAAHIVRDRDTGILAAACFEPVANTGLEISAVNVPALVMLRAGPAATTLSVCDPDLHLYQGIESDQFNPNGSQREVSIYSRTWFRAASAPSKVRVTLEGNYALVLPDARVTLVPAAPGHTMLEFTCREGLPVEVQLARQP